MKENKEQAGNTLIFIPDISGFTSFVSRTEIQHAKHIIEELLETLIDSNEIGLELSEIEGDAILFYRSGRAPTSAELLAQIQKMYVNFHGCLKRYETHRICSCGACSSATNLKLKVISHYGEVANKVVKDRNKLFGREVIVAHRLLKNNVPSEEYCLFSDNLLKACSSWVNLKDVAWSTVHQEVELYDFGQAKYCYVGLGPLAPYIPTPRIDDYAVPGLTKKLMELEKVIEAPLDVVFDVVTDMEFRHHWFIGVRDSDMINHKISQNGSRHRCVIKGDKSDPMMIAHDFKFAPSKVTFVETNHRDKNMTVWELAAIGQRLTRIKSAVYMKPNLIMKTLFDLFMKKKQVANMKRNGDALNSYCKQLVLEGREHQTRVVLPREVSPVPVPEIA